MTRNELTTVVQSALTKARHDMDHPDENANPFGVAVTLGGAITALQYLLNALKSAAQEDSRD